MEATITLEYSNNKTAKAVATAISPDNFKAPDGLFVTTVQHQKQVVTKVKSDGKIVTFIATIDDLLFSAVTAEKTLHTIQRQEKRSMEKT